MSITNGNRAKYIENILKNEEFRVGNIETKERKTSTPPPFMTSSLQQTASNQLGFSPKKTMMIAQTLYEGVMTHKGNMGVITYMRTDSLNIAKEAIKDVRKTIKERFGENYLSEKEKHYTTKSKGAQDAHEAIRPTNLDFSPQVAREYLKSDELKLYTLIYNRFLATQMRDAIFQTQNIIFESNSSKFKASGRVLKFDGFYRAIGYKEKDKLLPTLKIGERVEVSKLEALQHFTEPPARYSEASLIKKLESLGIGRPSTYAPTISILVARKYIEIEKKQLIPTEIAFKVIELLEKHFSNIVDSSFTAQMEETLDKIAEGKEDWQKVLWNFYEPFMKEIDKGKKEIKSQKVLIPTGEKCPKCGSDLVIRQGRFGEFISCSAFPKCKYTKNISSPKKKESVKVGVKCPECGGELLERSSRRGKFYGCSNYPKCKFVSNYLPTEKKCSKCGGMMAQRTYKNKEILECIKCKHKEDL